MGNLATLSSSARQMVGWLSINNWNGRGDAVAGGMALVLKAEREEIMMLFLPLLLTLLLLPVNRPRHLLVNYRLTVILVLCTITL